MSFGRGVMTGRDIGIGAIVAGLTATTMGASMMVAFATEAVVFAADIVPFVAFMAAARFKVSIGMHWL